MITNLEELKQKRLNWVEINRENGFDEGIKHLLTDLYPDNAHFVYELLQNAEDPGATEVKFTLTDTEIEFEHNGKRLFTLEDVDSITSIGTSTKSNDNTSIGKFGVGFKAVFAYTSSPEIYSGQFNFRIHDLVVPSHEGIVRPKMGANKTRIFIPFNHPKKTPKQAVKEIERSLLDLGGNTLLFLNHIKKIEYVFPKGQIGSLERFDHGNGHIEIRARHRGGTETCSNWLHFQKEVNVIEEGGKGHLCTIAIAFSIKPLKNKNSPDLKWEIVPLEHGQVSIFFPAEKETSNLRFHLHAPFASTVARDSVRDCLGNDQLRNHIAELLIESLISIRDQGLLTVNFLAVLPNLADNLSEFYEPIRKKLVNAFNTLHLTPTKQGISHCSAQLLYRGPAVISNTLSDSDMVFLIDDESTHPFWVANAPQENQREDRFIKSLDIKLWGWDELTESINEFNYLEYDEDDEDDEKLAIENWLSKQSDSWMHKFYALLGEACTSFEMVIEVDNLKIIRVETDTGDHMIKPNKAFVLPEGIDITPPKGVYFVKKTVFSSGKSRLQNNKARSFLEYAGVSIYDEHQEIRDLIDKYLVERKKLGKKKHLEEMSRIVSYWSKYPHQIKIFENTYLLMSELQDLGRKFFRPYECFLDQPFEQTGLEALFNCTAVKLEKTKCPVLKEYFEIKGFTDFSKNIGVMSGLEIRIHKATIMQNNIFPVIARKTETTIDMDFYINGAHWWKDSSQYSLGRFDLNQKVLELSFVVWQTMCKVDKKYLTAFYRPNDANKHKDKHSSSFLVTQLRSCTWIPDKTGVFLKPQDITDENLHPQFQYDNQNGWLTAIGFGESEKKRSEEYIARNQKAQDLGFDSLDELEELKKIKDSGVSLEEIMTLSRADSQPEESIPNLERRRKGVLERKENAPEKQSIMRERKIQPHLNGAILNAKAYLRIKYTNDSKETVCQCCRYIMPFKIGTEYYFEAVQCFKGLEKLYFENRLALCPTCAAKYQYALETDDVQLRELIINADGEDELSVEIPVTLAKENYSLRFVATHWFDLKTILEDMVISV